MRVGVLGGTFDPPHLAHLVLAASARQALDLDRVLFIPAGEPWRKAEREVAPAEARLRMVEAAVADVPWAAVSAIEIERSGPTYTCETLEQLAAGEGGEWWLLLGEDALHDMPHWHEPARILAVARLAVARRRGDSQPVGEVATPELRALLPGVEERIDIVPMPLLEISSTALRERVREGGSTEFLLPAAVRAVIDELGLYRG